MSTKKPLNFDASTGVNEEILSTDDVVLGKVELTGVSGIAVDAGSNRIIDVAAPVAPTDAANRAYVDGVASGGITQLTGDVTAGPGTGSQVASVTRVYGATVPPSGALLTGNTLQVTGAATLGYGPINLAGGAQAVTGVLPDANQAAQSMGGDVTGTTAANTVGALQGQAVAAASIAGQYLRFNGTSWAPTLTLNGSTSNLAAGDGSTVTVGTGLNLAAGTLTTTGAPPTGAASGDLSGSYPAPTVAKIQGHAVSSTAPTDGQVLLYNSSSNQWEPNLAGDATALVYQPGGVATRNVFTSWAALMTAFGTYEGPVNIVIDDSLAAATIPAGTWDLESRASVVPHNTAISPVTTLTVLDGAVLRNPAAVRGQILVITQGATTPNFEFTYNQTCNFFEGAQLQNVGSQPCARISIPGQLLSLGFYQGAQFSSPGGAAFVDLSLSGVGLIMFMGFFPQFSTSSVVSGIAGATLTMLYDNSVQGLPTNPGFFGTKINVPFSNSALTAYDDTLVPPTLGSSNVQGALDSLKVQALLSGSSAGGDLGGTYPNPSTEKLHGATAPAAGALLTGNVLQVIGSSTLDYGPVNLAGGAQHVDGLLPSANQAPQVMIGDVSGTTAANVVDQIKGQPVTAATSAGEFLRYDGSAWTPTTVLAGAASELAAADGSTVTVGTGLALAGATLTATGAPPTGSASGDLSGSYPAPTVSKINGATAPTAPLAGDAGKAIVASGAGAYALSTGKLNEIGTASVTSAVGGGVAASDTIYGATRLSVAPASASAPIAVGANDPAFTNAVPNSRQVLAGNGLTGGGALTSDVTLSAQSADVSIVVNGSGISAKTYVDTQDAATLAAAEAYAQGLAFGISSKAPVYAATTAALPVYAVSGGGQVLTATAHGFFSIDGLNPGATTRVLVKNEAGANAPNNGVYVVTQAGGPFSSWVLTRADDANTATELCGALVTVEYGSTLAGSVWLFAANPLTFVIGSTNVTFTQLNVNAATVSALGTVQLAGGLGGTGTAATAPVLALDTGYVSGLLPNANQAAQSMAGDVTGTTAAATVAKLQSNPVSATAPVSGQFLGWSGTAWEPANVTPGGGGGGGFVYYFQYGTSGASPAPASAKKMSMVYAAAAGSNTGPITVPNGGTYATLATFVTDAGDPALTLIPGGLWDINLYVQSSAAQNQTAFRYVVQTWDGSTATTIATSDDITITSSAGVTGQYLGSVYVPPTTVTASTRLIVVIEGRRLVSPAHTMTLYFEGVDVSHIHTSIGAPGGTGLVKVVNGVTQTPASLLFDSDVDATANISGSKLQAASGSNAGALAAADYNRIIASGDVSVTTRSATVTALRNQSVTAGSASGQYLRYNGSAWVPTTVLAGTSSQLAAGDGSTVAVGNGLTLSGAALSANYRVAWTPAVSAGRVVIYVRTTGNDSTGTGTLGNPYLTLARALQDVPQFTSGIQYTIDVTNMGTMNVGTDFVIPPITGLKQQVYNFVNPVDPQFYAEVDLNISAVPTTLYTGAAIASQPADATTGLITLNVTGTPWSANAYRGKMIFGSGVGEIGVIASNTTSSLEITATTTFTAPFTIVQPSATIAISAGTGSAFVEADDAWVGFNGIGFTHATSTSYALTTQANAVLLTACSIQSALFQGPSWGYLLSCAVNPSAVSNSQLTFERSANIVNSYLRSIQFFGGRPGPSAPGDSSISASIADGCSPLGQGDPYGVGYGTSSFDMSFCEVRNSTSYGIFSNVADGTNFILNSRVSTAAGDAIRVTGGRVTLTTVVGTGSTGYGVHCLDFGEAIINSGVTVTGTSGDMKAGALATRTWANFAANAPIGNEFDVQGQGSRIHTSATTAQARLATPPLLLVGSALTSAATIAPTAPIHHVTGTAAVATISDPYSGFSGTVTLIPDGAFTWTAAGNIGVAGTATVGQALCFTKDAATSKWYPSYTSTGGGGGGTVTNVTASTPLASSGGATPNISLTGTVAVANGGTGLSTLTTAGNILVAQSASSLSSVAVSGDAALSTSGTLTVSQINGASVPAAGALVTGNVPQVSGASSLTYGPINLAGGANYVSGSLPAANQDSQPMAGDVTGTTAAAVVERLTGNGAFVDMTPTIPLQSNGINLVQIDGSDNVIVGDANHGGNLSLLAPPAQVVDIDISGSVFRAQANGVAVLGGTPDFAGGTRVAWFDEATALPSVAPTSGAVLYVKAGQLSVMDGTGTAFPLQPIPATYALGGDLSGTTFSASVDKIHGSTVPAGGSLATGNVLQVSGSSSLTYGPINLAGGVNYVSGALPIANGGTGSTTQNFVDLSTTQSVGGDKTFNGTTLALSPTTLNIGSTAIRYTGTAGTTVLTTFTSASTGAGAALTTTGQAGAAAAAGSTGGNVTLASGVGGAGSVTTGGNGGATLISTGAGGAGTTTGGTSGVLNLRTGSGGSGTVTGGNSGGIYIDPGSAQPGGTNGTITIGTSTASALTIGRTGVTTTVNGTLSLANALSVANGGTGLSTLTAAGNIVVAQTATTASAVAVSGDASLAITGALTVSKINGSSVPAGGALTTGNVLQVNGASSLTYGAINLAGGAGYVTGILPAANQAAQTLGGDLSGTTSAASVDKLHGATAPAAGALTTGNVLQVNGASSLTYGALNLAGGANYVTGVLPLANHAGPATANAFGYTSTSGTWNATGIAGTNQLVGFNGTTPAAITVGSGLSLSAGTLTATGGSGTVTSVTASAPLASSGGAAPNISINYGASGSGTAAFGGYTAVTANYTALTTDYVIDCTANSFTVTLPTAVGATGRMYVVKNTGTGTITIATTSSQTIDGSTTVVVSTQYAAYTVMSNGANWVVI